MVYFDRAYWIDLDWIALLWGVKCYTVPFNAYLLAEFIGHQRVHLIACKVHLLLKFLNRLDIAISQGWLFIIAHTFSLRIQLIYSLFIMKVIYFL